MDETETPVTVADNPIPENPAPITPGIPTPPAPKNHTIPLLLILGLIVLICLPTIYFFRLKSSTPPSNPSTPAAAPLPSPTIQAFFLNITSPAADTAITNGQVLVAGTTLPSATVVAYSDQDETVIVPDAEGKFESTVIVGDNGGNLTITAYADSGEETSQNFTLLPTVSSALTSPVIASLSLAKTEQNRPPKENPAALNALKTKITPAPTALPPKIAAFLKAKNEKATPKKLTPAQIKALLTESDEATPGNKLKTKPSKEATVSGQYQIKPMKVKTATASAVLKRHAVAGVITNLEDGVITLSHFLHRDRLTTIYYNANTLVTSKDNTITSPAGLTVGMRLTAVGEPNGTALLAKRLHVIPGKATGIFIKNPMVTSGAKISPTPVASPSASVTASPSAALQPSPSPKPSATPTSLPKPSPTLETPPPID